MKQDLLVLLVITNVLPVLEHLQLAILVLMQQDQELLVYVMLLFTTIILMLHASHVFILAKIVVLLPYVLLVLQLQIEYLQQIVHVTQVFMKQVHNVLLALTLVKIV